MKHVLVVADGMADVPLAALKGLTPLEAARTPRMDRMAREGRLGRARFVPAGTPPGCDAGILAVLGVDVRKGIPGRGALEAAGRGVTPAPGETVFRASFCTVSEGRLVDPAPARLREEEVRMLCEALNAGLGEEALRFVPGLGYRALALCAREGLDGLACRRPDEAIDRDVAGYWPSGPGSDWLRSVMERSHKILDGHEVNLVRRDLGENPANLVWLWGPGGKAELAPLDLGGRKASMIAGVDLAKGIGRLLGMTVLDVKGATGDAETDLAAKAKAALASLKTHDLAVIHVEAPDAASHAGDPESKVRALERIDLELLAPLLEEGRRVALVTDHVASTEGRCHLEGEVPVALWGPGFEPRREGLRFDEPSAAQADLKFEAGHEFLEYFLEHR